MEFPNKSNSVFPFFNDHGTWVAGIAGAVTNNQMGVAGVAGGWGPNDKGCKLLITAAGDYQPITHAVVNSILYATQMGADVISMSLMLGYSQAVVDAIELAYNSGILVISPTGIPEFHSPAGVLPFPANLENCFAVGGSTRKTLENPISKSELSNWGEGIMVVAPCEDIRSLHRLGNQSFSQDGTSGSAPQVAGTAGLIKSYHPDFSVYDITEAICITAWKFPQFDFEEGHPYGSWSLEVGYGKLNADRALGIRDDINTDLTLYEGNYIGI